MNSFFIDSKELFYDVPEDFSDFEYQITSIPRDYSLKGFVTLDSLIDGINSKMNNSGLVLIDNNVFNIFFKGKFTFDPSKIFFIKACEETKNLDTVLGICDSFITQNINKISNVFVIGGGVLQDLGGTSSYLYKRGIPWQYIPTTLLGISDSCLGGKTAVNYKNYKNLLGLFSAPKEVLLCHEFIASMTKEDIYCGFGEIFRLLITGGENAYRVFEKNINDALDGNNNAQKKLILSSLLIKRAVIEADEYEINIRKSMNYGHTIGHAIEAISSFRIPHGIAVTLGILIETKLAVDLQLTPDSILPRLVKGAQKILEDKYIKIIERIAFDELSDYLRKDKKTMGNKFNFSYLQSVGNMQFSYNDIDETKDLIINSKDTIIKGLTIG